MPCVNCGGAVLPGEKWEVGHIIPASQGGQTILSNTGPAHYRCQRLEGGRLGSRIVNGTRQAQKDIRPW
jgi:5-methylcytosine-specific restriction endonuclease McrA